MAAASSWQSRVAKARCASSSAPDSNPQRRRADALMYPATSPTPRFKKSSGPSAMTLILGSRESPGMMGPPTPTCSFTTVSAPLSWHPAAALSELPLQASRTRGTRNSLLTDPKETEWVAYMSETTRETRRLHWMNFNMGGTIDWGKRNLPCSPVLYHPC